MRSERGSTRHAMRDSRIALSVRRKLDHDDAVGVLAIEDAFARAQFETLRVLLRAIPAQTSAEAARIDIVRARFARAENDVVIWYEAATRAAAQHPDPAQRLFARTLKALARKQAEPGHGEAAIELAAVERALWAAQPPDIGGAVYLLAVEAWKDRDYERAESLLARNYEAGVRVAETRSLSGWIDIKRERYAAGAVHFEAALAALEGSGEIDERLRARLVHGTANVAAETINFALGARARAAYEATAWTDGLAVDQFNALTMLRYLALLEGDLERAWLLARQAATLMPEAPYAVHGETAASFVSELLGDERAAAIQLQRAWRLLRGHRWSEADHEERVALTDFAMTAARMMPAEARQAITIYQSLRPAANPLNALEQDRRVNAFEMTAAARVSEALGDRKAAVAQYNRALATWRELGHHLRVGQVAADLYRLTNDAAYARILRPIVRRAPRAWFGAVLRSRRSPLDELTAAQRRVLDELLQGKSAKTIAANLDRSHHTVSNHTRKIFAAFRVKSRTRLLANCVELGITAGPKKERPRRRAAAPGKQ